MAADPVPAMFDEKHYVPILLTRQGERHALREVPDWAKARMTPLFVVHPVDNDPATGLPKKSVEAHLDYLARWLPNDWGLHPAFVDLRYVEASGPMSDGSHAIAYFIARCRENGLQLSPALSTEHTTEYRAAAVQAADDHGSSPLLRLSPAEWHDIGTPVGDGRLLGLVGETRRPPSQLHLMLDVQDQIATTPALTAAALRPVLRDLPHLAEWLSLTVAGTGMPVGTAAVGRDGNEELPRSEWDLWRLLSASAVRAPAFADYCVQHPNPLSDFNPLFMDSSAQLRYAIPASWFVVRGRGMKVAGAAQVRGLAAQVVAHPEYAGPAFSWGDQWLENCATGACSAGTQGVWRKVTTNHHLMFVVDQLATLFGL
jgi:hypothetical protein